MCRPIAWVSHLVSGVGAINWGLLRYFQFNIVAYIAKISKIAYMADFLYALIMICGIFSILSLFAGRKRKS